VVADGLFAPQLSQTLHLEQTTSLLQRNKSAKKIIHHLLNKIANIVKQIIASIL
jgi:hypothetical protein